MAEYKKKQIKRKIKPKPAKKAPVENRDIKMSRSRHEKKTEAPQRKPQTRSKSRSLNMPKLNVIKGKKAVKNKNNFITISVIVIFVCIYLIISAFHPVGMLEYLSSCYAKIGHGKGYDLSLTGGETLNAIQQSNYYYILSENTVEAYNNGGKNIFSVTHGMSKPVLKTGDTRYLVYSQGEKTLKVHTFNGLHNTFTFDNSILTANISKSGTFAVATKTEGYESKVTVYNKRNKKIYEWFSSDETVISTCLSDNGKRLAVATVKVENGAFVSKVYILKFNSANPTQTYEFEGELIYSLNIAVGNHIYAVLDKNIEFINMVNGNKKSQVTDYSVNIVKKMGNRIVAVKSLEANKNETDIYLYSLTGELKANFKLERGVSDISVKNQRLHILTDSSIVITDKTGRILSEAKCSFDIKNIVALSDSSVAGISNNSLNKYLYDKTEAKK